MNAKTEATTIGLTTMQTLAQTSTFALANKVTRMTTTVTAKTNRKPATSRTTRASGKSTTTSTKDERCNDADDTAGEAHPIDDPQVDCDDDYCRLQRTSVRGKRRVLA